MTECVSGFDLVEPLGFEPAVEPVTQRRVVDKVSN